jgi:hypothetical protein
MVLVVIYASQKHRIKALVSQIKIPTAKPLLLLDVEVPNQFNYPGS